MNSNIQAFLTQIKDTSFVELVQSQNLNVLSQLIEIYDEDGSKEDRLNFINSEGFSPLHKACIRGLPEIIGLLLKNGSNPNAKTVGGETASHFAARRGNPVILDLLVKHNADIEELDNKGQSIVHNAVMADSVLVLLWIETSTGMSLKSKDVNGITPLHLSCMLGKSNCIKFFLRKSYCDINEKTPNRDNCLHLVIKHHQFQCIPLILFHDSRPTSYCSTNLDWNQENSTILTAKNANNKTPIDLYLESPVEIKNKNRSFSYLFYMLTMTSLKQMELNLMIYRVALFLFPFLSFLIGILLSVFMWPNYKTIIFPLTSVFSLCFVRSQTHRIGSLDTRQNPIFAGAFLSGFLHDLLCYRVNIYKDIPINLEAILLIIIVPLFIICYLRLIIVNPGKLQISEILTRDFSHFLTLELNKQKLVNTSNSVVPMDRFCQVCETAPNIERVKHCKLCNSCIVNMDHHCLYLMKCIARNNIRNFIFLIIFTQLLIFLFIKLSMQVIINDCGPLSGASPLPYVYCSYTKQTWISTAVLFNIPSFIWGLFMLYNQFYMLSFSATNYFHSHHNVKISLAKRIYRIVYFMIKGRYYQSNDEKKRLSHI